MINMPGLLSDLWAKRPVNIRMVKSEAHTVEKPRKAEWKQRKHGSGVKIKPA